MLVTRRSPRPLPPVAEKPYIPQVVYGHPLLKLFSKRVPVRPLMRAPSIPDGHASRLLFRPIFRLGPLALLRLCGRDGSSCVSAGFHGSPHKSAGAHVSHAGQVSLTPSSHVIAQGN